MTCIGKAHTYSIAHIYHFAVWVGHKLRYGTLGICEIVEGLDIFLTFTPALTAAPLGFKFLYMCGVTQHYGTEVAGRFCGVYLARKAACIQ